MKLIFLVGDGMADEPIPELGGRTPLEAANVPNMDRLAREGVLGLCRTIPEGLPLGSDVANLSLLGYDPRGCYTGRGPLEAVSLGIELGKEDCAFRCNLVNVAEGRMVDYSSGHISTEDGGRIAEELDGRFSGEGVRFYRGVGYRHICVVKGDFRSLECTPPHDITGRPVEGYLPRGEGASKVLALMQASISVLSASPVNRERADRGMTPATQIWLWGQGYRPELPRFARRFGVSGSVITAVDLIRGIGTLAGLEIVPVQGATGFVDTNYEGKADAALKSLEKNDFVFVHVEAPDEAGHAGKTDLKIKAIEDLDRRLLGRILGRIGEGFRILLMPDHPTPIRIKTHSGGPVPFALWGEGIEPNGDTKPNGAAGCPAPVSTERGFTEREAEATGLIVERGHEIINLLFQGR